MTDRFAIARVGELAPGQTKKFLFQLQGQEVEGFLLNVGGQHHAYVNRCRHVPMSLDWVENQFFTEESVVAITGKSLHTPRYRTPPVAVYPLYPGWRGASSRVNRSRSRALLRGKCSQPSRGTEERLGRLQRACSLFRMQ